LDGKQKMSRSHYRWVIVAAGGLLGCVAIGAMFSLPVFLRPISQRTGWSITGVSSAMTFGFLAMAFAPMMACVTGWFDTSQPSCVSRFRRHGNGANDHVSIRGAPHFQPRLENVPPNPRRTHRSRYDSSSDELATWFRSAVA
jgi:hypothetical protein